MRFVSLLWLALTLVACASSTSTTTPSTRRDSNRLTAEELAVSSARDVIDAIESLRPAWLRAREKNIAPVIYLDNVRQIDIGTLRGTPLTNVAEISFLNANDATTRFGTGHAAGAIMVKTK